MSDRIRVYHPETGEPFDVSVNRATSLRLEKGWLSHPIDPTAEPAVTSTTPELVVEDLTTSLEDWRETEVGKEIVGDFDPDTTPSSNRRSRRKKNQ